MKHHSIHSTIHRLLQLILIVSLGLSSIGIAPSAIAHAQDEAPPVTATSEPASTLIETPVSTPDDRPLKTSDEPAPVEESSPAQSPTVSHSGWENNPFPGIPINYLGETAEANGYEISLKGVTAAENTVQIEINLVNNTERNIELFSSLQLYGSNGQVLTAANLNTEQILAPLSSTDTALDYALPAAASTDLSNYQLVYMPFGYSDAIFVFSLTARPEEVAPPPQREEVPSRGVYGTTGDPWKMLVLIYPNIDVTYVDTDGQTKHLTAAMPQADLTNMTNAFLNLPHRNIVQSYSNQTAELEANIVTVSRPLTKLARIYNGYWPSPDITRPELNQYAPKGKYDSVIIFWQASDPATNQYIPNGGGWGWGYWPGETYANGMTYASVYNLNYIWTTSNQACHGEVFLHEWLHGVTGFYMSKGVSFNRNDLHGAEEAGYSQDYAEDGCWDKWLTDYMRGLVYVNGQRKALVPELSWQKGSLTTWTIKGWRGEYFNNETLSDTIPVLVRDDSEINFDWLANSPHPLVNPDHFSARWTKTQSFNPGLYNFYALRDDGIRVWVDNQLILDKWEYGREAISLDHYLDAGLHTIRAEAYEIDGWASAIVTVQAIKIPGSLSPIDSTYLKAGATSAKLKWKLPSYTNKREIRAYELQMATDSAFTQLVTDKTTRSTSLTPKGLLPNTTYYWRVRALFKNGTVGRWTSDIATQRFVTVKTKPPALTAPGRNSKQKKLYVKFSWRKPKGTPSRDYQYVLQYGDDYNFGTYTEMSGLTKTRISLLLPQNDLTQTIYWRVKVVSADGSKDYSDFQEPRAFVR